MKAVVITGVSTGIGYSAAHYFVNQGISVFGSVRTKEDGDRLVKQLGSLFYPLLFDITDEEKVNEAALQVRKELQGNRLWGLINNAGIVIPGPFLYMSSTDFRKQLEVNLVGQLIVTKAFIPLLGEDTTLKGPPGKIINLSSVSGKRAFPFMGAYAVSKYGIEAFSEALRRELMVFGIDVVIVGPGTIKTPIWSKAKNAQFSEEARHSVYGQAIAKLNEFITAFEAQGLAPENVAKLLWNIMQTKHPKVRYAPMPNKFINWFIPNLLPIRFIDWLIAKKFNLLKNKGSETQ